MGQPFAKDLRELSTTYDAACQVDINLLAQVLCQVQDSPLIAVGSGGSLTAAHFAASLHERFFGSLARAATPLDAINTVESVKQSTVLLFSAGGTNPDIMLAFKALVELEPARLIILCGDSRSSLVNLASKYPFVDCFSFNSVGHKDGFLATNSLLGFCAIVARTYMQASNIGIQLPPNLNDILPENKSLSETLRCLRNATKPLWGRQTTIVLFSTSLSAAAIDLESKFTEAALGNIQMSDLRNFAHGRHHWLAKHGRDSSVLALIAKEDGPIASKTINLLPGDIPKFIYEIDGQFPMVTLAGILSAFLITEIAGKERKIDPGRPGVPKFGRRIYHLRMPARTIARSVAINRMQTVAIERKSGSRAEILAQKGQLNSWIEYYQKFSAKLKLAPINSIVLDYDGTLCETRVRHEGMRGDLSNELIRLMNFGIRIGVVTGRGKSVRIDLQRELPRRLWNKVWIGYYNSAEIGSLGDATRPSKGEPLGEINEIAKLLDSSVIKNLCGLDIRSHQISVTANPGESLHAIWLAIQAALQDHPNVTIVRSGHSLDIFTTEVTKLSLVTSFQQRGLRVLCIGDRGKWPGNDYALLSHDLSLSVHEVSTDPATCWNLAPAGFRGTVATLYYLQRLCSERKGIVRFNI